MSRHVGAGPGDDSCMKAATCTFMSMWSRVERTLGCAAGETAEDARWRLGSVRATPTPPKR